MVKKELAIFNIIGGSLLVAVALASGTSLMMFANLSTSGSFILTIGIVMMVLAPILYFVPVKDGRELFG